MPGRLALALSDFNESGNGNNTYEQTANLKRVTEVKRSPVSFSSAIV